MVCGEAYVAYLAFSLSFLFHLESLDFRKRNLVGPSLLHKLHTLPYKLQYPHFGDRETGQSKLVTSNILAAGSVVGC